MVVAGGFLSTVVGLFTIAVGVYVFSGSRQAILTLREIKNSKVSDVEIFNKFNEYDKDNDGYLAQDEFELLVAALLGYKLSPNELESAMFILDQNDDNKITKSEFKDWWESKD